MTVLIAGAGIGGLVTALGLEQIGVPCLVLESVAEVRPLGVGINLLPHAVRELSELGLGEQLEAKAVATAELAYWSKRGQPIWREPRGRAAGYNWPQLSIHRGTLQMELLAAVRARLGPSAVRCGAHVAGFEETAGGVRVALVDRASGRSQGTVEGRLLIAADGIHSSVRAHLHPGEGPPKWNGAILWRGVSEAAPFLTGRSMIMAGHERQKFVCYPIAQASPREGDSARDGHGGAVAARAVINWVAELKFSPDHEWRREDWSRPGVLAEFLPRFEDWRFDWLDVPGLIRSAPGCLEYPMVDRDPLPAWQQGRVTLLGDAAHPMYPIGSNGASQAILDARVLAREIKAHGPTAAALAAYEAERRPATARIVLANRGNGPEQVMQLVEERAPGGYGRIEDVLSAAELEEAAAAYKRLAGFDRETLNSRPPIVA